MNTISTETILARLKLNGPVPDFEAQTSKGTIPRWMMPNNGQKARNIRSQTGTSQ